MLRLPSRTPVSSALPLALAAVLLPACSSGPSDPPPPQTLIEVVAGSAQVGAAESTLATLPAVRVTDTAGQPLENVTVSFEVGRGGGSIEGGSAVTNADGIATGGSWTLGPGSGLHTLIVSARDATATVTAHGTLWIAVGDVGTTATSPTGETWTLRETPVDFRAWGVASNDTMWVAVGYGPGQSATSLDGIEWKRTHLPFSGHGVAVAWNGSIFVAMGDGTTATVAVSADGETWEGHSTPFQVRGRGLAYGDGQWVATGEGGTAIATSPDGIEWTARASPFDDTFEASHERGMAVAWNGELWVAVGEGRDYRIATSPDGITWTGRESEIEIRGHSVVWNGEFWMVVGERGSTSSATIVTSTDGIEWTRRPSPYSIAGWGVEWDGQRFVTVGTGRTIGVSTDGESWSAFEAPFPVGRAIAWSGPR